MSIVVLQAGDVFLTRGASGLGRAIRRYQRTPGEDRSVINHGGGISAGGTIDQALAVEAGIRVRQHKLYNEYGGSEDRVAIARPIAPPEQRRALAAYWQRYVGHKYGVWQIGCHWLDWMLSRMRKREVVWARRACNDKHSVICSTLVAHGLKEALGWLCCDKQPDLCQPDDIWDDWYDVNPQRWEVVLPLCRL